MPIYPIVPPSPGSLPSQVGNAGRVLSTDGTNPTWIAFGGPLISANLTGLVNGSNTTYTTPSTFVPASLIVFSNGLKLKETEDYSIVNTTTISLVTAPLTGSILGVIYRETTSGGAPLGFLSNYFQTVEKYEFFPGTILAGTLFDKTSNGGTYYVQVPTGKICELDLLTGYITEGTATSTFSLEFKKSGVTFGTFSFVSGNTVGVYTPSVPTATSFNQGNQITVTVVGSDASLLVGFVAFLNFKFT